MGKRILSVLLTLTLAFGMLPCAPATASADDAEVTLAAVGEGLAVQGVSLSAEDSDEATVGDDDINAEDAPDVLGSSEIGSEEGSDTGSEGDAASASNAEGGVEGDADTSESIATAAADGELAAAEAAASALAVEDGEAAPLATVDVPGRGTEADPYVITDYEGLRGIMGKTGSDTIYLKLGASFSTRSFNGGAGVTNDTAIITRNSFVLDLNGYTAELYTESSLSTFLTIAVGILTIKDSSSAQTGKLMGYCNRSGLSVPHVVNVATYGGLVLDGGEINLTSVKGYGLETVYQSAGNVTINGGAISEKVLNNGELDDPSDSNFVLGIHNADTGKLTINGGNLGAVCVSMKKRDNPSVKQTPNVVINGGTFGGVYRSLGLYIGNLQSASDVYDNIQINGGTFNKGINVEIVSKADPLSGEDFEAVRKLMSDNIFPESRVIELNASTGKTYVFAGGEGAFQPIEAMHGTPFTVTGDSIGVKGAYLDGASITYTHNDPKAPLYDVKRTKGATVSYEWYDMPEIMKAQGYSYTCSFRTYKDNVYFGVGPAIYSTKDGICTWTFNIPADNTTDYYYVYFRLNILKDGELVNSAWYDDYITRFTYVDNIVSLSSLPLVQTNGSIRPDHYYGNVGGAYAIDVVEKAQPACSVSSQTDWAGTFNGHYFIAGETYTKTVVLRAKSGYRFTRSCSAMMANTNGNTKVVNSLVSQDGKTLTVRLRATAVVVLKSATGTLTGFQQGKHVSDLSIESAEPSKYSLEIAYVGKNSSGTLGPVASCFEKGKPYIFGVKVVPARGYAFLETGYGEVTLNVSMDPSYSRGDSVSANYTTHAQVGSTSYDGVFFETEAVNGGCYAPTQSFDGLNVDIKYPVPGESAADDSYKEVSLVDAPEGYTVEMFQWETTDSFAAFTGTFEAGKRYYYHMRIERPWWVEKLDSYPILLNGETVSGWNSTSANEECIEVRGSVSAMNRSVISPVYLIAKTKTAQFTSDTDLFQYFVGWHFKHTAYSWVDPDTGIAATGVLTPGKTYLFKATYAADAGYRFATDGSTVPTVFNEDETGTYVLDSTQYRFTPSVLRIEYPFTIPGGDNPSLTVSGRVRSFGDANEYTTIQLIERGASEAAYETALQGAYVNYFINDVTPGTYTMKVMKNGHVTRTYAVTVGSANVKQDALICPLGDVSGNGVINAVDAQIAYDIATTALYSGRADYAYMCDCADITEDGEVYAEDAFAIQYQALFG